jgi:hypothetical protein
MKVSKTLGCIASALLVIAGSLVYYLESYTENEIINGAAMAGMFLGWAILFHCTTANTSLHAKRPPFSDNKIKWLRHILFKGFSYVMLIGLIVGNFFYISDRADNRMNHILDVQPTSNTTAVVNRIERRRSKNSSRYYAIFQYTINNKLMEHPRYEHDGDFTPGDKYVIKYSIEYPEMFRIVSKLPVSPPQSDAF